MNRPAALLAAVAVFTACSAAFGLYSVSNEGKWPKTWPAELEPLRKQSRTLVGPWVDHRHYQVPFTKREDFEAAWPHVLKVKSKGAPVFLVRAPHTRLGRIDAGVFIHSPPTGTDPRVQPEAPLAGDQTEQEAWMWTTYIELIVDGDIVDLNRVPLPPDTPIIDQRFRAPAKPAAKPAAPAAAGGGPPAAQPPPATPATDDPAPPKP